MTLILNLCTSVFFPLFCLLLQRLTVMLRFLLKFPETIFLQLYLTSKTPGKNFFPKHLTIILFLTTALPTCTKLSNNKEAFLLYFPALLFLSHALAYLVYLHLQ